MTMYDCNCDGCKESRRRWREEQHDSHPLAVIAFWSIYGTILGAVAVWWLTR